MLPVALVWGWVLASSSPTTVAPPRDLQITDPGLLGSLDVEWKPPPHVQTFNECTVKYKFEYRNTGDRDWKVIFTRKLKFRVGFDLSRTAEVRLQTLLKGWCTDDVEVQSDWIYATFQVPPQGKLESEVQNFHCIYHDWEYLKCSWQPGLLTPHGVHYGLYYWYEGLDHAVQCDHYIQDRGTNVGCVLRNLSQAEYQDLNICVNGSAAATLLRPLYTTLRLHNLAKPSAPKQLVVSMSAAEELLVAWSPPGGRMPPHCLEYEVQVAEDADAWAVGTAPGCPREGKGRWGGTGCSRVWVTLGTDCAQPRPVLPVEITDGLLHCTCSSLTPLTSSFSFALAVTDPSRRFQVSISSDLLPVFSENCH